MRACRGRLGKGSCWRKMFLYVITPSHWCDKDYSSLSAMLTSRGGRSIACVQWRCKNGYDREREDIERVRALCMRHGVALVLNDGRHSAYGDGVHLGRHDYGHGGYRHFYRHVRGGRRYGRGIRDSHHRAMRLGVSCYGSYGRALAASMRGAESVAFGAFFATRSKAMTMRASLSVLYRWRRRTHQVATIAIGGIGIQHVRVLQQAGVDYVAMISGIWAYPQGAVAAVEKFSLLTH